MRTRAGLHRRWAPLALFGTVVCSAVLLSGRWDTDDAVDASLDVSGAPVSAHLMEVDAFQDLESWKSVADHVAVFEVISEEYGELSTMNGDNSEGRYSRRVRVRIDETLSSFPTAPEMPSEFEFVTLGANLTDDGVIHPLEGEAARLEVGNRYVGAFALIHEEWALMSTTSSFALDSEDVLLGVAGDTGIRAEMAGMGISELESELDELPIADEVKPISSEATSDDRAAAVEGHLAEP